MIVDELEPLGYRQLNYQDIPVSFAGPGASEPTGFNDAVQDLIFEEPVENWKNFYQRITPDMGSWTPGLFRTVPPGNTLQEIFLTAANWTDSGLKLPANYFQTGSTTPGLMVDNQRAMWHRSPTWSVFSSKITAEYDFNADEVTLVPSNNMDIFLIPRGVFVQSEGRYFDNYVFPRPPGDPSEVFHQELLNYFWRIMPREVFFETHALYAAIIGNATIEGYEIQLNFTPQDPDDPDVLLQFWEEFYDVMRHMSEYDDSRSRHIQTPGGTTNGGGSAYMNDFVRTSYPDTYGVGGRVMSSAITGFLEKNPLSGTLKAVIKKGDQFYYVWRS